MKKNKISLSFGIGVVSLFLSGLFFSFTVYVNLMIGATGDYSYRYLFLFASPILILTVLLWVFGTTMAIREYKKGLILRKNFLFSLFLNQSIVIVFLIHKIWDLF